MNDVRRWWGLGQRVAPPRFILFVIVFAVATPLLQGEVGTGRAVMGGFDIAAAIFLASMIPLFRHDDPVRMRRATRSRDRRPACRSDASVTPQPRGSWHGSV